MTSSLVSCAISATKDEQHGEELILVDKEMNDTSGLFITLQENIAVSDKEDRYRQDQATPPLLPPSLSASHAYQK